MVSPIQEDEKLAKEMPSRANHDPPGSTTTNASSNVSNTNTTTNNTNSKTPDPNANVVTLTPATATARSGRIIDDPARGTIFWEADAAEDDNNNNNNNNNDADSACSDRDRDLANDATATASTEPPNQTIGLPFRIQWLSTERVPFHRTRGLRNPWNANRGVKIARDGTEIEPSVGAQVVELFHLPSTGYR